MTLTIYQTNDLHSNFENIARIAAYIKDHRKKEDLFLDCGDLCDLKDITVQGTRGIGAVRILKHAGVDAMAVGNNEIDSRHRYITILQQIIKAWQIQCFFSNGKSFHERSHYTDK